MRLPKINLKPVGEVVKTLCGIAGYGLLIGITGSLVKKAEEVGYSDAIDAVVSGYLTSDQKQEVISMLRTDGTEEYYKAVISVLNSYMCSDDKVETIKHLSEG